MKQLLLSTVGDLKKALADIPDNIRVVSFGPDSGGYDVEDGDNIALSFNGEKCFIAHDGSEHDTAIWDKRRGKIIGRLFYHCVFSTSEYVTIEEAKELVSKNPELFNIALYSVW
jgi:hypothetical protein